jgi:quercetin dioxygenase-like cupin family protein
MVKSAMRKLIPSTVWLGILVLATLGFAQDPVKLSPQFYRVLLDNEHVRVLEYRLKPGEKEPMHSHPAGIVYVFDQAKLKVTYLDGRSEVNTLTPGETYWREPVTHMAENVGNTEAHAIAVEQKKPCN